MSSLDNIFASVEPPTKPPDKKRTAATVAADAIGLAERSNIRLILMQGPVGAGKTTIATELSRRPHVHCVSADDFFIRNDSS